MKDVWDSGLKIIKKPTIYVHPKILSICNYIQSRVGEKEFSIVVKGRWQEDGFYVSDKFEIPEQEVGYSSVDYLEDLTKYKMEGYNVIIHSHPFSRSSRFSSSDEESINAHFDCSLLYTDKKFDDAVISLQLTEKLLLQVECDVEILFLEEVEEIDLSKIKEKYTKPVKYKSKKSRYLEDDFECYSDYIRYFY